MSVRLWMDRCMHEGMDERMDGWTDGQSDWWKDRWQPMLTMNTSLLQITMDSQTVRPPVSRYGFRIEDTGHMYMIRTPSYIQIQWLHSSGLMILEASKASKAQGHGLCGEVGPSWGRGLFPWSITTRHRFLWTRRVWDSLLGQRWDQQSCQGREV